MTYEELYRDNDTYNIIEIISYNYPNVIKNKDSAIFFHIANSDYSPTQGCITIFKEDF